MTFPYKEIPEKNAIILEIPEKLNLDNSEELRLLIKEKVEDGHFRLIFDMMKTNYVDSTGLGAIVSRIAFVRSNQGDIRLAIQSDFVKELLDVTNLNKILKCYDSVEEAVNSFDEIS
jgi:anti-sigma B factor antagonist